MKRSDKKKYVIYRSSFQNGKPEEHNIGAAVMGGLIGMGLAIQEKEHCKGLGHCCRYCDRNWYTAARVTAGIIGMAEAIKNRKTQEATPGSGMVWIEAELELEEPVMDERYEAF